MHNERAATSFMVIPNQEANTSATVRVDIPPTDDLKVKARTRTDSKINNAVYAHLRAIRALGHTKANSAEVAKALHISIADVENAMMSLRSKGVKVSK